MTRISPTSRLVLLLTGWAVLIPALALEPRHVMQATGSIEYALTPEDDAAALIIRTIEAANSQIFVQAFSFTHRDIAQALIRAHRRKIDVQVIVDYEQTAALESEAMQSLIDAGVLVFTDAAHAAAHNKVMVIDPYTDTPVLITGSFNFTFAAQYRNAENVLVLHGNQKLVRAFHGSWMQHREHAMARGH